MTEWYFGHDGGDLVVLKDQEYFDRLPSPDSWLQWETCGMGGNSGWANTFDSGNLVNKKPQQRTLSSRGGNKDTLVVDDAEHALNSGDFRASSEDCHSIRNSAASVRPDYYFNDLTRPDSEDDIFLYRRNFWSLTYLHLCVSSLLQDDDLPLQSLYIAVPSESDSTNKRTDFPSFSCDTEGVGHAHVSKSSSRNNSDQSCCPSVKVLETRDMVPSDHEASRTFEVNGSSPLEESVLSRLETVRNQLNDKTRLCLRDSLYRLAKHSEQQTSRNTVVEGFSLDEPSLPETSGVCTRSRLMETAESETNAIDRAVAYLMFSKVDPNVQDHLPGLSPQVMQSDRNNAGCDFNQVSLKTSDLLVQCEVPVFSQQTQG